MAYECIVWCDTSKNLYSGCTWTKTSTGIIEVKFDGFVTEDTNYFPIVRGEVPSTGTERTVIKNLTTSGFTIENWNYNNALTSYDYCTIAVFYDPQKCISSQIAKRILGYENTAPSDLYDFVIQPYSMLYEGWNIGSYRYFGVERDKIGVSGTPNFVIHDAHWSVRIDVNITNVNDYEFIDVGAIRYFKILNEGFVSNISLDSYQADSVYCLYTHNGDKPYETNE